MVELKKLLLPGSFSFLAAAFPSVLQSRQDADKPAAFFLAGDSTTVTVGGWGGGFLNTTLVNGAWGTNFASSGTTTVSFRGEGHWNDTIEAVKNVTANGDYTAWVTIQVRGSILIVLKSAANRCSVVWPQRPESRSQHYARRILSKPRNFR